MYSILTKHTAPSVAFQQPENRVVLSKLHNFDCPVQGNSFSIKYVVKGVEHYRLNDGKFSVGSEQYLLANQHCDGRVVVDSHSLVTGVCIGIDQVLLSEVVASHRKPGCTEADLALDQFFHTPDFLQQQYNASDTRLGSLLRSLSHQLTRPDGEKLTLTNELYFRLAECIVADHIPIYKQLQQISAVKWSTKKDLYKRVANGKAMLDAGFALSPSVNTVAREAGISEYHFFRLFRTIYGTSPHQYLLQQKLASGYALLRQGTCVAVAAVTAGFPDSSSFSRAFRKMYGKAPSAACSN